MSGPTDIPGDQLRTIVERIEHIDEEIKELNEAKREIFTEAKSNGFDVKTLREVIRILKKDKQERDEQETLLDLYMQAIETAKLAKPAAKRCDDKGRPDQATGCRRRRHVLAAPARACCLNSVDSSGRGGRRRSSGGPHWRQWRCRPRPWSSWREVPKS